MRLHRFYVNFPLGEEVVVENGSAEKDLLHQWTNVFRYTNGDEVFLFSPSSLGEDVRYRFSSLSKSSVALVRVSSTPNIIPSRKITLVMAIVKKDTFETIVRQATELGITCIIPVLAARSEKKNLNFERLSSIATEASEQCGRGDVPQIASISSFTEATELTKNTTNIIGSLHGKPLKELISQDFSKKTCALWVGPEGGWTEEEESSALTLEFLPYKFTETVLKADTAAISLLSNIISI